MQLFDHIRTISVNLRKILLVFRFRNTGNDYYYLIHVKIFINSYNKIDKMKQKEKKDNNNYSRIVFITFNKKTMCFKQPLSQNKNLVALRRLVRNIHNFVWRGSVKRNLRGGLHIYQRTSRAAGELGEFNLAREGDARSLPI